jgi:hypothetical protein
MFQHAVVPKTQENLKSYAHVHRKTLHNQDRKLTMRTSHELVEIKLNTANKTLEKKVVYRHSLQLQGSTTDDSQMIMDNAKDIIRDKINRQYKDLYNFPFQKSNINSMQQCTHSYFNLPLKSVDQNDSFPKNHDTKANKHTCEAIQYAQTEISVNYSENNLTVPHSSPFKESIILPVTIPSNSGPTVVPFAASDIDDITEYLKVLMMRKIIWIQSQIS